VAESNNLDEWSDATWTNALERLNREGVIEAPSVRIDAGRVKQIREAAPRDQGGRPSLSKVDFTQASFGDGVFFPRVRFGERASFDRATFGVAFFPGALFEEGASFDDVSFKRSNERASFDDVRFNMISFQRARFGARVSFRRARFELLAEFDEATFGELASLDGATFDAEVSFDRATFAGRVSLHDVTLNGRAHLGAVFREGVELRAGAIPIALDGASFGGPSLLADSRAGRPRVVSLRGADVRNLVLSNVDLSACRFMGAHNLDQLRIGGNSSFARTLSRVRWDRRQAIAEEHEWRAAHLAAGHWERRAPPEAAFPADWLEEPELPSDREIATTYRALRKAFEDQKNEPGAADFYYGEMEMRRHDKRSSSWAERLILTFYWALSGYGLRASRAFLTLLVTVIAFAAAFHFWGFASSESFGDAVLFAVGSSVRVASAREHPLNATGDALHIALGVIGPVLLGLGLLAIRGRVRR
jgi:uncharacterized protein YjbI with pentapeptide repeats